MNDQTRARLKGLMGLSVRAGQAVFGQDGCLKQVRGAACAALLLDEAASANTRRMYTQACQTHGVPCFLLPEGLLLEATGKPGVAMALARGGLGTQILNLLNSENT